MIAICSEEKQNQCQLATSLDHMTMDKKDIIQLSDDQLKNRIHQQLICDESTSPSVHDPTKSSVRLVTSNQAGNGKSLWIKTKCDLIKNNNPDILIFTRRFHEMEPNKNELVSFLYECVDKFTQQSGIIFHFDLTNEFQVNLDDILFSLVLMNGLMNDEGKFWKRNSNFYFLVECSEQILIKFPFLELLPKTECYSPRDALREYKEHHNPEGEKYSINKAIKIINEKHFYSIRFNRNSANGNELSY